MVALRVCVVVAPLEGTLMLGSEWLLRRPRTPVVELAATENPNPTLSWLAVDNGHE
jgi:hypothetical protein